MFCIRQFDLASNLLILSIQLGRPTFVFFYTMLFFEAVVGKLSLAKLSGVKKFCRISAPGHAPSSSARRLGTARKTIPVCGCAFKVVERH